MAPDVRPPRGGNVPAPPGRPAWDRATLDASGDGYTVLRAVRDGDQILDWTVVDANALVQERWGWVVGDVVGVPSSRLNAAADNSAFHELYVETLRSGERQVLDVQLNLPAAKGGWRRVVVTPLDADTVSAVTRDISRERYLEAALERERSRPVSVPPRRDDRGGAAEAAFAGRTAAVLFLASGVFSLANSVVSKLPGVDVTALRLAALGAIGFAAVVPALPWERHFRAVANSIVLLALAALAGTELITHYSRSDAAIAVYPVFFILLVAWAGLVRRQGAATIVAVLSSPLLYGMFASSGRGPIGLQCLIVTMPGAAALGEVLSWSAHRARALAEVEVQRRLHDPLTGLGNRTLLLVRLDHALERARRGQCSLALLYIDLDHFKRVNDTLGHNAGDDLLVRAAGALQQHARSADTIVRLGGDEFVVLCEELASAEEAVALAARLAALRLEVPGADRGYGLVTPSVGVAFSEHGGETADALLQNADLAMYRAKEMGRARSEVFGQALRDRIAVRRELEDSLRGAVGRSELRLHYQPVVTTADGRVVGVEALVRWDRPGYGLVPPAEFIPVAEESGIINEIGAWVIGHACQQASVWGSRWPARPPAMSVNVSAAQLARGNVVEAVRHALATSRLDPRLLTVEITETALIDSPGALPVLRELRGLGVGVAIDDFGTGYSSLTHLRQLPVTAVKIDRSFVRAIGKVPEDTAIAAAIIDLAGTLGLGVVAEGVETPEQLATLRELGCGQAQGYLISMPLPAEELDPLLAVPERLPPVPAACAPGSGRTRPPRPAPLPDPAVGQSARATPIGQDMPVPPRPQ